MGSFGGYYKGDKKKKKKEVLERQAQQVTKIHSVPRIEIIGKGKREK